jgi:DMSO reductase anchor subunit
LSDDVVRVLGWSVVAAGGVAIACSIMIYASVRRELWDLQRTTIRFGLTSIVLGLATLLASLTALEAIRPSPASLELLKASGPTLCRTLMIVTGLKLAWEAALLRHLLVRAMTPLKRTAMLMTRDLANVAVARFALGLLAGIVAPGILLEQFASTTLESGQLEIGIATALLFVASLGGELLERYLFFAAVAAPRMPGGIR